MKPKSDSNNTAGAVAQERLVRLYDVDFWDIAGNTYMPVLRLFLKKGYTLDDAFTNATACWGPSKLDHTRKMTMPEYKEMMQTFDYFKPGIPNTLKEMFSSPNNSDQKQFCSVRQERYGPRICRFRTTWLLHECPFLAYIGLVATLLFIQTPRRVQYGMKLLS